MDLHALLEEAGLPCTSQPVSLSSSPSGQVWKVGPYVAKSLNGSFSDIFEAEARGLRRLQTQGCRTPDVLAVSDRALVTTYMASGSSQWGDLAEQLALLHTQSCSAYTDPGPTYLGAFKLPSAQPQKDWGTFWRRARIAPLVHACDLGDAGLEKRLHALLESYQPPQEGPVWIHGDLWNGNVLMTESGAALIDPSCWVGERAVDLAMMDLFGGFPGEFWRAYERLYPIPNSVRDALPFYQIYYLLVHVHLFGKHYLRQLESVLLHYGYGA